MTLLRFRCPHCKGSSTVERGPETIVHCPSCTKPVRLPKPKRIPTPQEEEIEDVIEVPEGVTPSLPPSRGRPDSWEEENEPARTPRRSSRRATRRRPRPRREPSESYWPFDFLSPYLVSLIGLGALALILVPVSFLFPPAGAVCFLIGLIANFAGGIWILMLATRDGELIFVLLIPFYSLFYIVRNLDEAGKPALLQVVGAFMMVGGGIGIGAWSGRRVPPGRLEAAPPPAVAHVWALARGDEGHRAAWTSEPASF